MQMSCSQDRGRCCCGDLSELLSPAFFKALGDPNRLAILTSLAGCCEEKTVSEISECCSVDLSVVSRHLAILREAGVLSARKRGKQLYHSVRFGHLARVLREIADAIEACCATPVRDPDTTIHPPSPPLPGDDHD
jgi:DNA-binding transcriptional ArsR family regulator